jgi:hypothetical protein
MDFKGPFNSKPQRCIPLTILDDHSRYVVGLYALKSTSGPGVHKSLLNCFNRYGLPEAMLMDHGVPWWSTTNGHGLTWLTVDLMKQDINMLWSGYMHPQTQGKVERFHRTLQEGIYFRGTPNSWSKWQPLLEKFRHNYNDVRPHESLDMATPSSRYKNSLRCYNPNPPAWEYPEGAHVRRLNVQGRLAWENRYYFVCEALAKEWVQVEPIEDKFLVRFRNMYIREIDPVTKQTLPIIYPAPKSR